VADHEREPAPKLDQASAPSADRRAVSQLPDRSRAWSVQDAGLRSKSTKVHWSEMRMTGKSTPPIGKSLGETTVVPAR